MPKNVLSYRSYSGEDHAYWCTLIHWLCDNGPDAGRLNEWRALASFSNESPQ